MAPALTSRRARGDWAEEVASRHLAENGLKPVARNYRCKSGEIDLVMRDGGTLVFVEVRYRSRTDFGGALESIDEHKVARVTAAAEHYLACNRLDPLAPCRFDVVCVGPGKPRAALEWIRDAFQT